jgi:hypothetical protein
MPFDRLWVTATHHRMELAQRQGAMTDVRLDHALLARHACRWWAEVSHEYKRVSERGHKAGD